ncbi:MAG: four helix bundle protein [Opitutales bacterium]
MGRIETFEDLDSWQASRDVCKTVYHLTDRAELEQDWVLRDQMRRAAISIMSNIAEGFGRHSNKEFIQFLTVARGSAEELESQTYLLEDLYALSKDDLDPLFNRLGDTVRLINGLLRYLRQLSN